MVEKSHPGRARLSQRAAWVAEHTEHSFPAGGGLGTTRPTRAHQCAEYGACYTNGRALSLRQWTAISARNVRNYSPGP